MTIFGFDGDSGDTDFSTDSDFDLETDADGDINSDGDGGSTNHSLAGYFTIRNMVAFFMGFSWTGLACLDNNFPLFIVLLCSVLMGLVFVTVVMLIMYGLSKLKSSGTISLKNAIGKDATVSIMIPGNLQGQGKVRITFQGKLAEMEAATEGDELHRGQQVKVVRISNDQLVVEKI